MRKSVITAYKNPVLIRFYYHGSCHFSGINAESVKSQNDTHDLLKSYYTTRMTQIDINLFCLDLKLAKK